MLEVVKATTESGKTAGTAGSRELALRLGEIADDKGGTDIVLIEIGRIVSYTDFLLICTARNERMADAIADEVRLKIKHELGKIPSGADGSAATGWQVLDYLDCVMHIFTAEARDRYQLEDLWRDAPRESLFGEGSSRAAASSA